jgi:steroid delta-isomerase-like uncharacterized protein
MSEKIAAANKEIIRRFYKDFYIDWNMAAVDAVVSPSFISHDWPADGPTGPGAFRDYYSAMRLAVPDAHYVVDDLIAENDKVVVRWRLLGTHERAFNGIPPTGGAITLTGVAVYRLEAGKLMERWVVSDLYNLQHADAHLENAAVAAESVVDLSSRQSTMYCEAN